LRTFGVRAVGIAKQSPPYEWEIATPTPKAGLQPASARDDMAFVS